MLGKIRRKSSVGNFIIRETKPRAGREWSCSMDDLSPGAKNLIKGPYRDWGRTIFKFDPVLAPSPIKGSGGIRSKRKIAKNVRLYRG